MKGNKVIKINRWSIKVLALSCGIWSAAQLGFVPSGHGQTNASEVGQWGDVLDWRTGVTNANPDAQSGRNVAVHLVVLPTGKVIMWPYVQNPHLWDPNDLNPTNLTELSYPGDLEGERHNIFCGAHSHTPDGRVLFTGGDIYAPSPLTHGEAKASYFNPFNNTWTRLTNNDMNGGRWYGTSTALANGDVLVTSGFTEAGRNDNPGQERANVNPLPQVWMPAGVGSWCDFTNATDVVPPPYTRTFLAPNGKVFFAMGFTPGDTRTNGCSPSSRYLDASGTGTWSGHVANFVPKLPGHNNINNPLAAACMDEDGTVYWFGGGDEFLNPVTPTNGCEKINLAVTNLAPQWTLIAPMTNAQGVPQPRKYHTATILPDGKFLITSGTDTNAGATLSSEGKHALLYNPVSNSWTTLAKEHKFRGYHSTAVLLPDGRVLSASGNGEWDEDPTNASAEIFSPPYLFSSGTNLAVRPVITSAPAVVGYGETFFVGTPDATNIMKVTWTRLGNTTHGFNWDQRINTLTRTQTSCGLNVTAPANQTNCPPGYYMLWLINSNGVPSVSRMVRISSDTPMFNLTHWKLTLPVDTNDTFTGLPREISTAQLNSGYEYVDPADSLKKYFFTGAGGSMVFQTPTNGAIQPGGAPRSELRGTLANGDEHNWTPGSEGGVHILDGICSVNAGLGKIVIGQIHAESGAGVPAVRLAYDTRESDPFFRVTVKHDPDDSDNGQTTHDFAGVPLNGLIHYQLKMVGGSNSVLLYVTVNGVTWTMDMNSNGHNWTNTTFYYKAGCYFTDFLQDSPPAQVTFYKLFQSEIPACGGGLVALWRGENNAYDLMGRNNGSMENGATYAAGIIGQGFSLDGDDDYVRIVDSASLDLSGGLTVELWYKSTAGAHAGGLFDKRNWTTCNYGVHFGADNNLTVYYNDPNYGGFEYTSSPAQSAGVAGVFHHYMATYRQVTSTTVEIKTYVDGELVQTGTQPGNLGDSDNTDPLAIGTLRDNLGGPGYNFKGVIDEVALYSRVLTAQEALVHYKAPSGVVARWHGDGTPNDAVGTLHGTMENGATYAAAVKGSGFSFDGDNDYVRIVDTAGAIHVGTALSVEMWYGSADGAYGGLIDKRNWDTCNFGIHMYTDTNFVVYYNDPNFGGFEYSLTPAESAGTVGYFHHLVATYRQYKDGSDYYVEIKTYIDGTLVQTDSTPGYLGDTFNSDPLSIGTLRDNLGGPGYNFHGIIDEVTIYNRVLDADEVEARYIGGLPETDTILSWNIVRGTGGDSESIYHTWTLGGDHPYSYLEVQRKGSMDADFVPWDQLWPLQTSYADSDPDAVEYRIRIISPKGTGPWATQSIGAVP